MIDPDNPVYNTLVFYFIFVFTLLIVKPKFMYCDKNKKFKQFGFGDNQTMLSFPVMCITSGILFYMLFLWISVVSNFIKEK